MANLQKTYIYKVFRGGVFLGNLQNVSSEFGYSQQINSAGAELEIYVEANLDTTSRGIETIQTESLADLTDESGNALQTERALDVFGDSASTILVRNENDVEVWMINSSNPNGKKVFAGYISTWEASFASNDLKIKVLSYGVELDNYIIQGGN